jgi:predicted extracellular nuclease
MRETLITSNAVKTIASPEFIRKLLTFELNNKAASSTSINLVSVVNSTSTTLVTGVATAVAATWFDVGFYYNGTDVLVYASDNLVARVTAPTIGSSGTTLTNALLSPVFQITPTATDTMTIDFVAASVEVLR